MKELEVLAPAGDINALKAAVVNGANAVYLGLNEFSARAKADNFSLENLKTAVDYAHLFNVKVYVAMNTLLKDEELDRAEQLCLQAYKCGIDAIIIQDFSLSSRLCSVMPDIVLHASTQMGIHNLDGAKIAQKMGYKRIILSREVLLEDIKDISKNTDLEIEVFVQGALCVAFSGNCYFSSLVSGYSGNRGKCMQLCRKPYIADGEKAYWLSPADLCLVKKINQLIESGVVSFKIEGRLRRPEYVAESVKLYRNALDGKFKEEHIDSLKKVFNRGDYCLAHYDDKTSNIIYPNIQNHKGLEVGFVKSIKDGKAFVTNAKGTAYRFHRGDGLKFVRNGLEIGGALVKQEGSETTFDGDVQLGDCVHITTDAQANSLINTRERRLPVKASVELEVGSAPIVVLKCGGTEITYQGDFQIDSAINSPISKDEVIKCFSKSGEIFEAETNVKSGNVFIAKGLLNDFRRKAYQSLENEILLTYERMKKKSINSNTKYNTLSDIIHQKIDLKSKFIMLQVENIEQLTQRIIDEVDYIVINPLEYNDKNIMPFYNMGLSQTLLLNIPNIIRGLDRDALLKILSNEQIENVVVNNIGGLELCKDKKILLGIGMNILNNDVDYPHIQSIELEKITDNIVYSFGNVPLMTFCHCPVKVARGCDNCIKSQMFFLSDERGNRFNVRRYKINACYSQLLNSIPLNILKRKIDKKFIDAVGLNAAEVEKVVLSAKGSTTLKGSYTVGNLDKVLY